MNGISGIGSAPVQGQPEDALSIKMLKKSQDLAKDQSAQLLAALPPPKSPSPPGVGGNFDMHA